MTNRSKSLIFALFLTTAATIGFSAFGPQLHAQDAAPAGLTKEAIGPLVREYLLANPEVVIEAVEAYQKKQENAEAEKAKEAMKNHTDFLQGKDEDASPVAGNPKGDITIVEFFDYNCGYCKKALTEVQALLEADKNVRVVFKEMPILSPTSNTAAQWALAAQRQGKYFEFHQKLMTGSTTPEAMEGYAKEVGLDVEKLKKDAADPKIAAIIANNIQVSQDLGIRGTPAFVINDQLIGGYIEADQMKQIIASIREGKTEEKKAE